MMISESMGSSLYFTEQTIKNGATEGFNDIMGAGFTDNPNKTSSGSKTFKGVSHPKGASRIPHSSRPRTRLGCSSGQRYSKSAIIFSEQQMRDTESIAEKLTIELKSIKDILDVVLRSEFCRNKSLRYKVNEV